MPYSERCAIARQSVCSAVCIASIRRACESVRSHLHVPTDQFLLTHPGSRKRLRMHSAMPVPASHWGRSQSTQIARASECESIAFTFSSIAAAARIPKHRVCSKWSCCREYTRPWTKQGRFKYILRSLLQEAPSSASRTYTGRSDIYRLVLERIEEAGDRMQHSGDPIHQPHLRRRCCSGWTTLQPETSTPQSALGREH